MVFRDGETTIELPLCRPAPDNAGVETLQGIYKTHTGAYVILRAKPRIHIHPAQIEPYLLERTPVGWDEKQIANHRHESFFERQPELSHMELTDTGLRGIRLGIRAAIKTEKEQRARNHGSHEFTARVWHHWYGPSQYPRLYRKICYRVDRVDGSEVQDTHYNVVRSHLARFSKSGKWQPFDDMDRYHRIEAIDANGKARIFTFDIEDRQEIMPNRELKRMGLI
jgi:hypothetical protein